jgi:hypothetical protein
MPAKSVCCAKFSGRAHITYINPGLGLTNSGSRTIHCHWCFEESTDLEVPSSQPTFHQLFNRVLVLQALDAFLSSRALSS